MQTPFKAILIFLFLIPASAFAGKQQWACLEAVGETQYGHRTVTLFHKVTITERADGQLRGNYTLAGKAMMNYNSIDVTAYNEGTKFLSEKPGSSIQEFALLVYQDTPLTADVVVESNALTGEVVSSGKVVGSMAYLKIVYAEDDRTKVTETGSLICNRDARKLFVENP